MNLNKNLTLLIVDVLEELSDQGIANLTPALERLFNELMKIEREQTLQASPYERTELRKGYANGFKNKTLQTRFGKLDLDVPKTRGISFYPSCLEKGDTTEKALKNAIAEMYIQGVSTRRVKRITEQLCGVEVTSSQVSRMSKILDEELAAFRRRPLGKIIYLYLDADYHKVRYEGHVRDLATLKAIGVNEDGYREVLGISCSLSEAEVHWRQFLEGLAQRGLHGIELTISDHHPGLRNALKTLFPSVPWQRCLFHLAQNAQSYVPHVSLRQEVAESVKEIYQGLSIEEAELRMRNVVRKWEKKAPKFSTWLEENFSQGLTFLQFPKEHWRKIRTVNVVERLNQEVKRRTRVARLFPNEDACERLLTAIAKDIHEDWMSGKRYLTI